MRRFCISLTARTNLWVGVFFSLLNAAIPFILSSFGLHLFYLLQICQYLPWFFWFYSLNRMFALREIPKKVRSGTLLNYMAFFVLTVYFVLKFVISLNVYMVASGTYAVRPDVAVMTMFICIILSAVFSVIKSIELNMKLNLKHKLLDSIILLFSATSLPILVYLLSALAKAPWDRAIWIWYSAEAVGCSLLFVYLLVSEKWLGRSVPVVLARSEIG